MAITGTGKTSIAPSGRPMQFRYTEDFTKVEVTAVTGSAGGSHKRKREREEEIRRASLEALRRRRRREELEAQRMAAINQADASVPGSLDKALKKVFTIDGELERLHQEMLDLEIKVAKRKARRRKRDRTAVLLLLN